MLFVLPAVREDATEPNIEQHDLTQTDSVLLMLYDVNKIALKTYNLIKQTRQRRKALAAELTEQKRGAGPGNNKTNMNSSDLRFTF